MESLRIAGAAIVFVGVSLIVRQTEANFSVLLRMTAFIGFSLAALSAAAPVMEYLNELLLLTGFSDYALAILKSIGVAALCGGAATICRDLGEGSVASAVLLVGKIEIFMLCIPLIGELLDGVRALIFWQ